MPNSEMMKLTHKYGCMFECGWLPPTEALEAGDSGTNGASVPYGVIVTPVLPAGAAPAGWVEMAALPEASKAWAWPGIRCRWLAQ